MKPNSTFLVHNMEHLLDEIDGPINVWTFNKGSVENRSVENTHPVYYVRNDWGILQAIVIDSSGGCRTRWEIKV